MKKKPKNCEITLFSGMNELFRTEIPIGCITDQQLKDLLRCLVGKASLSFQEICDSYVKRNTRKYVSHLEVNSECNRTRTIFSCGSDPYAVAIVKHRSDDGQDDEAGK
jgi:hypothetical protein